MHLAMLLQMAGDGMGERTALGSRGRGVTMSDLATRARRAGAFLAARPGERVALVDLNSEAVPIALFGSALADKPFVPINYRLADGPLRDLVRRTAPATVVVGEPGAELSEQELRDFVSARLRSTRTPERIDIRDELPFNETGKLLRRVLRGELADRFT